MLLPVMGVDLTLIPVSRSGMDANLEQLRRQAATGNVDALQALCNALSRIVTLQGCVLLPLEPTCHMLNKDNRNHPANINFAHSMLSLERRRELWPLIDDISKLEMPKEFRESFTSYVSRVPDGSKEGENCYGGVTEDCYGTDLQWVEAGLLSQVLSDFNKDIEEEKYLPKQNVAAAAYLAGLDSDTPVGLYWH